MAPAGLSDEKAARMLSAFRAGKTMRAFSLKRGRFDAYCQAHPEYAREALALLAANRKAGDERKAARFRSQTHCKHGHTLADAHVYTNKGYRNRACIHCRAIRGKKIIVLSPAAVQKVRVALLGGATIGQMIHGHPIGGGKTNKSLRIVDGQRLAGSRRLDPEFDRFVSETVANNNSRGQKIRYAKTRARAQTAARRGEINDYQTILAMLPAYLPSRDDIAQDIFVALLDKSLRREDVASRVKMFIANHDRLFPTKFRKFGDSLLVSLDEQLFDDGATTRGDNITARLWD
jgi:hypothetical protein